MRWTLGLAMMLGCSARGGYAEPGPLSQNAMPPSNPSITSSGGLQASPPNGRPSEIPPAVGITGNAIGPSPDRATTAAECMTDLDCVPASCCHARACTRRSRAPRCEETMCTEVCESGTLDCGAGSCGCVRGVCAARLRE